jgi:hypothetical protein
MTENGSYGYHQNTASVTPRNGLDWAWREVAKASGDIAKKEIGKLENALAEAQLKIDRLALEVRELRENVRF